MELQKVKPSFNLIQVHILLLLAAAAVGLVALTAFICMVFSVRL